MHTAWCEGVIVGLVTVLHGLYEPGWGNRVASAKPQRQPLVTGVTLSCHIPPQGEGHCFTAVSPVATTETR